MTRRRIGAGSVLVLLAGLLSLPAPRRARMAQLSRAPLSFEANTGQSDARVKFLARGAGYGIFLGADEAVLAFADDAVVRMRVRGANPAAEVGGYQKLPGKVNYFVGSDPAKWRTNIPTYGKVRYHDVLPGIDLDYYGNQRQLEYDFTVAPGGGTSSAQPFTIGPMSTGSPVPTISAGGIVNGASYSKQAPAAGSIGALFGTKLAASLVITSATTWPATLGGVVLRINDIAAPLYFVSPAQLAFQFPWELAGLTQAMVVVTVNGVNSASTVVTLGTAGPGLFTTNTQGTGQGSILIANSDAIVAPAGSIPGRNTRPAQRGVDYISIFGTGLGPVQGGPASGAPAGVAQTATPAVVTIGGVPATVIYSGLAPGFVGLFQVNALVPAGTATGSAVPLVVTANGIGSNTATIAVQ